MSKYELWDLPTSTMLLATDNPEDASDSIEGFIEDNDLQVLDELLLSVEHAPHAMPVSLVGTSILDELSTLRDEALIREVRSKSDRLSRQGVALVLLRLGVGSHSWDNLRLFKAEFLASMVFSDWLGRKFDFQPDHYGPADRKIYRDLDHLATYGDVRFKAQDSKYKEIQLTEKGAKKADRYLERLTTEEVKIFRSIADFATGEDWKQVLAYVYNAFPEYTTKSRISGNVPRYTGMFELPPPPSD